MTVIVERERWADCNAYKGSAMFHRNGNTHAICRVCRSVLPIVRGCARPHQRHHGGLCNGRTARASAQPDSVRPRFATSFNKPRSSRWRA